MKTQADMLIKRSGKKRYGGTVTRKTSSHRDSSVYTQRVGLSKLSQNQMKKYEGKFVGIVGSRVVAHGTSARKVLRNLKNYRGSGEKVFSTIPNSSVKIVK